MHPEDAKAIQMLKRIKGFDAFVRASMEHGYEKIFRGENLGCMVKVNVQNNYNFIESVVYGITGGLGFMLAIVLFATVRERTQFSDYPECFEGFPICLVSAALVAMAFMGFSGMKIF